MVNVLVSCNLFAISAASNTQFYVGIKKPAIAGLISYTAGVVGGGGGGGGGGAD